MLFDKKSIYRVKADIGDWKDYVYQSSNNTLNPVVDLRQYASPVENQGHLGSCTSQAVVGAYELLMNKEMKYKYVDLSRLFLYYNTRLLEGSVEEDLGAYMRDAVKALRKFGICDEKLWPYLLDNFDVEPMKSCYEDAKQRNIKNYFRIIRFNDILDALNMGFPVVFSTQVYISFDGVQDTVTMPEPNEQPIGGHAMCFVGYDLSKKTLIARNSFGKYWGDNGYCYIPFEYADNQVMDAWVFDINIIK